jgi:hypothetical protein
MCVSPEWLGKAASSQNRPFDPGSFWASPVNRKAELVSELWGLEGTFEVTFRNSSPIRARHSLHSPAVTIFQNGTLIEQ